jgi:hypothetical protein
LTERLRCHGVPAALCKGCGSCITDRHPRWNGIWFTPAAEVGAMCGQPVTSAETSRFGVGVHGFGDQDFGHPRQPAGD